jgi:serine/threonine-protein kinase
LLDIAINVAQALAYSHVRGVIHRDIKPENIWVGNFGEVIVLDWGVAKVWGYPDELEELTPPTPVDTASTATATAQNSAAPNSAAPNSAAPTTAVDPGLPPGEDRPQAPRRDEDMSRLGEHSEEDLEKDQLRTLTNNGQRLGTPLYMSPEQVRGSQFVDDRTDIFSLGVVIYEMLTQKEPFRGRSIEETFEFIQSWDPPKPRSQVPFAEIPVALDGVVMKALAKRADDRFQTMGELIAELQAVMDSLGPTEGSAADKRGD